MDNGPVPPFPNSLEATARTCCKTDVVCADVSLSRMASKISRIVSFNP